MKANKTKTDKTKRGKTKSGRTIAIILGALVLLAVICVLTNLHTLKLLLGNWFSPKEKLDTSTSWEGGKSYEHVPYSDVSDSDYLHLYVPESEKPLPLYIMVHGGGFFYNDLESRQAQLFYRYMRDQGYAVATINYRLGDEATYPAAIEDVKSAVRFLRANAEMYGLDSSRFVIAGESAGGYLACMAAVTTDEEFMGVPFIGEEEMDTPVSGKVQALVDFYGCVEFFKFDEEFEELKVPKVVTNIANSWMRGLLQKSGFSTMEEAWVGKAQVDMTEEEQEQYSVPYYAKKNLNENTELRVLVLHGDADITVPYLQSEKFAELVGNQIGDDKVTYRLIPNYGHAADGFYSADTLRWICDEIGW